MDEKQSEARPSFKDSLNEGGVLICTVLKTCKPTSKVSKKALSKSCFGSVQRPKSMPELTNRRMVKTPNACSPWSRSSSRSSRKIRIGNGSGSWPTACNCWSERFWFYCFERRRLFESPVILKAAPALRQRMGTFFVWRNDLLDWDYLSRALRRLLERRRSNSWKNIRPVVAQFF